MVVVGASAAGVSSSEDVIVGRYITQCRLQVEMSCLIELKLIKSNIKANCKQPKLIYASRRAI